MRVLQSRRAAFGIAAFTVLTVPAFGLDIILTPNGTLAGNAAALQSFERAAQKWEAIFNDPITVNINAALSNLGAGILGSTSSVLLGTGYTTMRNQMVLDAADEASNGIVGFLPTAAQFTAQVPAGFSLDGNMFSTKANLKAMGFAGLDGSFGPNDADIAFNTDFLANYHFGAGLPPLTSIDFETIAAHEIGHALGFISAVDDAVGTPRPISFTPLDMYRFSNANLPGTNAAFTTNPRSLVPGAAASFGDTVNSWAFSTGLGGDGRQASHWKDDALNGGTLIGMMDPILNDGQRFNITDADVRAFDLIGYDLTPVPEPASLVALGLGAMALLRRKRAKK